MQREPAKGVEESLRVAERLDEETWGVVPTRRGFAVRVFAAGREDTEKLLRLGDHANIQNIQNIQNAQNIQDIKNIQNMQNMKIYQYPKYII